MFVEHHGLCPHDLCTQDVGFLCPLQAVGAESTGQRPQPQALLTEETTVQLRCNFVSEEIVSQNSLVHLEQHPESIFEFLGLKCVFPEGG